MTVYTSREHEMLKYADKTAWELIPGWMAPEAAQIMEMIAAHQDGNGVLELGVFKGKLL
jgi:predicted O-methyltransferase YrrM